MLDVYVFQYIREGFKNNWWLAPAVSTVAANIIDTYTFFAVAYPFAIIGSVAVVLAEGAPGSVALRIGFASATAYAVGTMLDVYVFQYIREAFKNNWWLAPAVSTIAANIIDTYTFFAVAFNNSANEYMAANWMEIAGSQVVIKICVGLLVFLPAYGILLKRLQKSYKLN
jgi:uncharacterized PurR-regulated membrane protein YhhQ (DUF165 family)